MSLLALLDVSERYFPPLLCDLLDALLGETAIADPALRRWAETIDLDDIEAASYRLVPALYAHAGRRPELAPHQGRMKGIYRYYFYRNNRFLAFAQRILAALQAAGIDFVLFKGTSVLLQYHDSAALRSFGDCDILIRPADRFRAEELLAGLGLVHLYPGEPARVHSIDLVDELGNGFDLHWYALPECCVDGVDEGLWSRSRSVEWKGMTLRVPAPEDEILIAGINGVREIAHARADWLFDAALILKANPNFDWPLVRAELVRRGLATRFVEALGLMSRFVPQFPEPDVRSAFAAELSAAYDRVVATNATFWLDPDIDAALDRHYELIAGEGRGAAVRDRLARSGNVVRRMRFARHADGSVARLRAHVDTVSHLGRVFAIADEKALDAAGRTSPRLGEVMLEPLPGVLRVRETPGPHRLRARLRTETRHLTFDGPRVLDVPIDVELTNRSGAPWSEVDGTPYRFGLSWHLYDAAGKLVEWERPRLYFLEPTAEEATLLMPGDTLTLRLAIARPPGPGRWEARLDLVLEHVAWATPRWRRFPRITIDVT